MPVLSEDGFMAATAFDAELRFAITHRRLLELRYNGETRVVEPHDYGRHQGTERLLAYQLQGRSTARGPAWRDFIVAKIEACMVLEQLFAGSRGHQHTRHKPWDEVFARVE